MGPSFLAVVEACDNFRLDRCEERLVPFLLKSPSSSGSGDRQYPIGFLWDNVVRALESDNEGSKDGPRWIIHRDDNSKAIDAVSFSATLSTPEKRSEALKILCEGWREQGLFANTIGGRMWRNELYPVYNEPLGPLHESNLAFVIERAASGLFGIVTYGVHLTLYTSDWKIWVAKRSMTKQTWPGWLDNSAAGGLPYKLTPLESMVKEAEEEASLPQSFVGPNIKGAGAVSYFYRSDKGWLQPEVEYVYDLLIPSDQVDSLIPKPSDGEVESFELLPMAVVKQKMLEGLFKPNCAVVLLDFMIRHGHITPENEPHFLEILTRIHGTFGFSQTY
ncbi:hypothetical protein SISNIDRAFT_493701 [Sistotremastrum niveocremeum HHB9708]|uniref:Nudix hydrolase domain-containing protein n=1 Tax=Sistotremastrum niveocremeum HHB9708 TaxID=1314777 RepID=A0A164YF43_9AGAM|nr:hypothetical protein SISNIDRAFT_493701 [Sistotremastrum niveocremeum HHB9708]